MFGSSFNAGGIFKGIAGFINASNQRKAQKAQYEADKKWVAYNNTMRQLQAGQNNNTITENIVNEKAAALNDQIIIAGNAMKAKAQAEVNAAAVGTSGGSVEAVLFDIGRNEAKAQHTSDNRFDQSIRVMEAQRHKIAVDLAVGKQFAGAQPALGPSPVMHLFSGIGSAFAQNSGNTRVSSGTSGLL